MNDQRNLFVAIAISVAIMIGWQYFMPKPHVPAAPVTQQQGGANAPASVPNPADAAGSAQVPGTAAAAHTAETRVEALGKSRRIAVETPSIKGSIALTGARIDDITLTKYREEPKPDSPAIDLLSPAASPEPYWAEFGWVANDPAVKVPGPDSVWQAQGNGPLTPAAPLVLTWDNGEGLRFVRTYTVDENYMFAVKQRVENYGAKAVSLNPYALLARTGTPHTADMYILHEGPLGVFDGTLKEMKYKDLVKEGSARYQTKGGWAGITDKYWLTALVPDAKTEVTGRFVHQRLGDADRYQVDYLAPVMVVEPGKSTEAGFHLFTGAKQVSLLDGYSTSLGIDRFDLAIDFGWFYFLTKPFFYLLQILHKALGNMGLAILSMTVILKLAMFPLANKSYTAMGRMKKLQPQVQALQARYADDKMRLQQEMMALYKAEKVNPVSGCLPMMVQIPVFFALYKVLFVTIEMRHATFYGWIHDLSAHDPTNIFTLLGLIAWDPPKLLHLGIWPLIMGFTMWAQQKLNPQPTDPVQAKMMGFLPIVFTFLLSNFASGLVIYWAWSNTLSILQQWVIMKRAEKNS
jgi:YidC/Oxa1 family membrane protein insertase